MYSSILAAGDTAIWSTSLGSLLKAILAALGVIVLLIGVAKSISSFTAGTPGKGAKIILGTAVACAFLFNPEMVNSLINFFSTIVSTVISSGNDIADSAKTVTTVKPA
jgi:hypothetical protein